MRTSIIVLVFISASIPIVVGAEAELLFDFDRRSLSSDWSAVGKIHASRETLPTLRGAGRLAPRGHGVILSADGRSGLFAKSGRVPENWESFDRVSFWVYRSVKERELHPQVTMEVQAIETGGKARFWRKLDLSHSGWQKISLPLCWFRWGHGRIPRWKKIDRFGFLLRDEGEVAIDTVWATVGQSNQSAYLNIDDLSAIAFGASTADEIRLGSNASAIVLTNESELAVDELLQHLTKVAKAYQHDFANLPRPERPPVLFVFSDRRAYEQFPPRFAQRLNSVSGKPSSDGYTFHNVSTSYYSRPHGPLRPVFTHEFLHGLLIRTTRLPSHGDWFHEGTASLYQLRFHPQDNVERIVRSGIDDRRRRLPLEHLCNGKRIPTNRYWQAMTVVQMFLEHEDFRRHWPDVIKSFQAEGSTDLSPSVANILDTTWRELERRWSSYCRRRYAK